MAALILLAGCDGTEPEPVPGEASVGEARALGEAAEMLEDQRLETPAPSASMMPTTRD